MAGGLIQDWLCLEWHHKALRQGTSHPSQVSMATEVPGSVVSGQNFLGLQFTYSPLLHFIFLDSFSLEIHSDLSLYSHHVLITPYSFLKPPTACPPRTYQQRWSATIATPMEEGTVPTPSEPPPLPYSLHTRKKSIAFFWTIFVIDTLAQPLILYWCLWYLTDLSPNLGMSCAVEQIHPLRLLIRMCSLLDRHGITWRSFGLWILLPPS